MKTFHKAVPVGRQGFIAPLFLALIALLLIGGGAYVYTQKKQENQANQPATGNVALPQATSTAPTTKQTTSTAQASSSQTANWATLRQESGRYEVKYPGDWKVSEISSGSTASNTFGPMTSSGNQDPIVTIIFSGNTFSETKAKILDEQTILLDGVKVVRRTLIGSDGNKSVQIRTIERTGGLNFSLSLSKQSYLSTFDEMIRTFKFIH